VNTDEPIPEHGPSRYQNVTSKSNLDHSPDDNSMYSDPEETSHDMYAFKEHDINSFLPPRA
jgi:hypothetical protein